MKILILSDLHLECGQYEPPPPDSYDAVILAGDIRQGVEAIRWAQLESTFAHRTVVFVPGNHEYYGSEFHSMRELLRETAAGSNVHFLDRDELFLSDSTGQRVRILGATLWTDFALDGPDTTAAMHRARHGLNDFGGQIFWADGEKRRFFDPEDSVGQHAASRAWLAEKLAEPTADDCPTIVVTHHAPSVLSIAPKWAGHALRPCFASDLPSPFFEDRLLWVHGHIHSSMDYRIGNARVLANPRGYRRRGGFENEQFQPNLIVDVDDRGFDESDLVVGAVETRQVTATVSLVMPEFNQARALDSAGYEYAVTHRTHGVRLATLRERETLRLTVTVLMPRVLRAERVAADPGFGRAAPLKGDAK